MVLHFRFTRAALQTGQVLNNCQRLERYQQPSAAYQESRQRQDRLVADVDGQAAFLSGIAVAHLF